MAAPDGRRPRRRVWPRPEEEPEAFSDERLPHPAVALLPLLLVGVLNKVFTLWILRSYGMTHSTPSCPGKTLTTDVAKLASIWAVEGALLVGILTVVALAFKPLRPLREGSQAAIGGSLLASLNTASEYGFGGVIAALPGFLSIAAALKSIPHVLVNEAVTVTTLAGITGSASGGMSIALALMSDTFIAAAAALASPPRGPASRRLHGQRRDGHAPAQRRGHHAPGRTGLTHKTSYADIFAITCVKTGGVAVAIGVFYVTGIY